MPINLSKRSLDIANYRSYFEQKGSLLSVHRRISMARKFGPKRIADSTGQPDQRQRDNKKTPGNNPKVKPGKNSKP